jgi:HD-like signal output (HDOD) protein
MFVEGLLADIGHLVMFQATPEAADAALAESRRSHAPIHQVEDDIVGCNYAEVGAALATAWHLPTGFATAIGAQLNPAMGGPHATEAALLNVANHVLATEEESDPEDPDEAAFARIDPMTLARLDIDVAKLAAIRSAAREESAAVIALFFPNQG